MKALALQSQQRTHRLRLVIVVLVLLALPLLVYVTRADTVVGWAVLDTGTGASALAMAMDSPATLNDRVELASGVTGGKASGLGNPSGSSHALQTGDLTPPVITYAVTPSSPPVGSNGWYRSNVTVMWTVSDPESAITSKVGCDPVYITQDQGPTAYTCTATSAGGTASKTTVTIKRDTKVDTPVITGKTADGKPLASGQWTNQNVTVTTVPPSNDLSGIVGCNPTTRTYTSPIVTTFSASCMDYAGNTSYPLGRFDVKIERTPPIFTGASQNPPRNNNGWNNTDVTVTWSWFEDPNASGIDSANCTQQLIASGEGMITLPTSGPPTCKDKAGNLGVGSQYTVMVDKTRPVYGNPTAIKTSDGSTYNAGTWTKSDVQVSFYCSDNEGGSGLATTNPVVKTYSQEGANLTATASDNECVDLAGNKAPGGSTFAPIKIDKTKPKPPTPKVDPAPNELGWNNSKLVTVSFISNGDQGVGQSGVVSCGPAQSLTQETPGTNVSGTCTDAVGWVSDPATVTVKIDWTPPLYGPLNTNPGVSNSVGITAYSNGKLYTAGTWTNAPVEVWFQCSDALSGPVIDPVKKTVNQEGANLSATATAADCRDNAGNQVGIDRTFSPIKIDFTDPVIAGSRTPGPNSNGWNNTDVTVSFTCSDALSGLASGVTNPIYQKTVSTEGQNQSVTSTGNCADVAGNSADPASVGGINIDKTLPNAPTAVASPQPNIYGWNNSPVTVTFGSNGDAGTVKSGVVWCEPAKTLNSETPATGTLVSGTCKDAADNVSASGSVTVRIDMTEPVITPTVPPGDYLVGCLAKPEFLASDSLSGVDGVASVQGPTLTVLPDGSIWNRFTVTAKDKAGNVIDPSLTFDYPAYKTDGPFWAAPIDPNGTSLFNLGNTIPIKFQLLDCNNQAVTTADARLRVVWLGPTPPQQDVGTVTNQAGGDTGDKFRVTGDSYQYNWKTKGVWVGNYKISVIIGGVPIRSVTIGLR